jgi:hypothetical protein
MYKYAKWACCESKTQDYQTDNHSLRIEKSFEKK